MTGTGHRNRAGPRTLLAGAVLLPAGLTAVAVAAAPDGWSLNASISERLSLATNANLNATGAAGDDITPQSTTRLSATLTKTGGNSTFSLTGSVSPLIATDGPDDALGFLSPGLSANIATTGKRVTLTGGLSASLTSTQFADLLFGLDPNGNPDPLNTNLITGTAVQAALSGSFGLSYTATTRDTLSLNASAARIDFLEGTTSLTPYTSLSLGSGWTRTLTPRTDVDFNANLGWFVAENPEDEKTLSLDLSGGFSHAVNQRLSLNGSLGVSFTDTSRTNLLSGARVNSLDVGLIGDFGISYATPEVTFRFSLSQGLQPSTLGSLQNTSALNASASYAIDSLSSFSLSARAQLQSDPGTQIGTSSATTALRISPAYSYQLDRDTALQIGYTYSLSDQGGGGLTDSHSVFLSLTRNFNLLN